VGVALTRTEPEPRGLLFDLFGTLVDFDFSRLDTVATPAGPRYATVQGLTELLDRLEPRPNVEEFYGALTEVNLALAAEMKHNHKEVSSPRRFERTLAALGADPATAANLAEAFTRRHMRSLADAVVCPPGRSELLLALARRYRLGLISNFDYEPTAKELLRRYRLDEPMQTVLISDAVGIRKPAAAIFRRACRNLQLEPNECIYIGDSLSADVEGASAAGLNALWIHEGNDDPAPALASLAGVEQVPAWLSGRYGVSLQHL